MGEIDENGDYWDYFEENETEFKDSKTSKKAQRLRAKVLGKLKKKSLLYANSWSFRNGSEFEKERKEPRKSEKFIKGCRVLDESDETICQKEKSHQNN